MLPFLLRFGHHGIYLRVEMMLNFLLIVLTLASVAVLLAIIVVLSLWLHGSTSILFPGLGIVVASGLILLVLIGVEVALVFGAAYAARARWDNFFGVSRIEGNG